MVAVGAEHLDRARPARIRLSVALDRQTPNRFGSMEPPLGPLRGSDVRGIRQIIVGAGSGNERRPCDPDWVRMIRNRCVVRRPHSS
jgi:protein gp37